MEIKQGAMALSIALTIPTILLAIRVAAEWWPAVKEHCIAKFWRQGGTSSRGWFITGVFLGFVSIALDNSYWQIAWTAKLIDHAQASALMSNGMYPNIFFRQLLGIMAAYCHLRAAAGFRFKPVRSVNRYFMASLVAGVLWYLVAAAFI